MSAALLQEVGFTLTTRGWQAPECPGQPKVFLPSDCSLALQFARAMIRGRRLAADPEERQRLDDWLQRAEA